MNRIRKNKNRDGKALCTESAEITLYTEKAMENLRHRINVKHVNNEDDYLKCTSKPSYMSHKIFDNNSVAIHKSKLALTLNKPAYSGMCILEFRILMYDILMYNILKY